MKYLNLLCVISLTLVACDGADAELEREALAPLERGEGAQVSDDEFDLRAEYALKTAEYDKGVQTRVSPIDWSEATRFRALKSQALSEEAKKVLAAADIPALLPDVDELLERGVATQGAHWYAFSAADKAHTVFITGNNKEVLLPELDLLKAQPDIKDDLLITRVDGVVELGFNSFGAAYTLEVECAEPDSDPRCVGDDYIVELANELGLANPGGAK